MIGTYLSKEHSMSDVEYSLLTKEKVERSCMKFTKVFSMR